MQFCGLANWGTYAYFGYATEVRLECSLLAPTVLGSDENAFATLTLNFSRLAFGKFAATQSQSSD